MMQLSPKLEQHRIPAGRYGSPPHARYGAFEMPGPCGERLLVIASDGDAELELHWEHVSVSCKRRIPNWIEMSFVKDLFWGAEECVVQFHPPASAHVNNHSRCLHLWRYTGGAFPMPPSWTVGFQELGTLT